MKNMKIQEVFKKVNKTVLSNGFTIISYEDDNFESYYVEYTTKYGGVDFMYDKAGKVIEHPTGIAHFLEHVMFNMPYGDALSEFNKYLGSANAYTSYEKTSYLVKFSTNIEDNVRTLLDLVSEIYIDEEKVEKEKGIIIQEIGMYDKDPEWSIFNNTLKNSFSNIKYKYDILGSEEDVRRMTQEDLEEAYNDFYKPSNQYVVVVGKKTEAIVNQIKEYMDSKESSNYSVNRIKDVDAYDSEDKYFEKTFDIGQNYISLAYKYNFNTKEDSYENKLYVDMVFELLYTSFNEKYIKAQDNKDIDYTFEYDTLVYSNVILLMFFASGQDVSKFREFIEHNMVEDYKFEDIEYLKKSYIGKLLRKFDDEVVIARFLNSLAYDNISLDKYYDLICNFNPKCVQDILKSVKRIEIFGEIKPENEENQ